MRGRALPPAPVTVRRPLRVLPRREAPPRIPRELRVARLRVAALGLVVATGAAGVDLLRGAAPATAAREGPPRDRCRAPGEQGLAASGSCTLVDPPAPRQALRAPVTVWLPPERRERWLSWRLHGDGPVRRGEVPAEGPVVVPEVPPWACRLVLAGPGAPALDVRAGDTLWCREVGTLACSRQAPGGGR